MLDPIMDFHPRGEIGGVTRDDRQRGEVETALLVDVVVTGRTMAVGKIGQLLGIQQRGAAGRQNTKGNCEATECHVANRRSRGTDFGGTHI